MIRSTSRHALKSRQDPRVHEEPDWWEHVDFVDGAGLTMHESGRSAESRAMST